MSGVLYYRLTIRDAADTFDALILSSYPSDDNPFLTKPPKGDGESIDPLSGKVGLAEYVWYVADASGTLVTDAEATEATVRVITGLLGDSDGKWAGVNRKCIGYESTNGTDWTAIHAGYVTQVTLTGGIEYALHVGDSDRRERQLVALATRPTGTGWTGTNIVGAPPSFGPGTGYPPKWRFRVDRTHDDDGDLPSDGVVLKFVSGWALSSTGDLSDFNDPNQTDDVHFRVDDLEADDITRLNAIAKPYAFLDSSRRWVFGNSDGGLVATLTPTAGGTDITAYPYGFILPFIADFSDSVAKGSTLLGLNTYLALKWTGTLPADDTEYDLVVGPVGVSKDSPAHFSGHPVAFVTTLFDAYSIPYDSTSATSVTSGLGVDMRIDYRFTDTFKLWDGIEKWAFGPFGFAVRKNTDNEWEFYQTRTIPASEPSETLDEDAIHDPDRAILDLGTENQVTQVVWKMQRFKAWTEEMGGEVPADGIVTVEQTLTVNASDVDPDDTGDAGVHSITYEVPGLIFPYPIDPDLGVFLIAQSTEILRRWGRGCPSSDIAVLRSASIAALVGEFVVVDLDHKPTIDTGETVPGVRGGARICQVVHRTLDATGPMLGLLDVGVATTNELVPTFTLAQGTDTLHQATVTLTNSGDLTGYQVQWQVATGASEPSGGTLGSPFDPDAVAHNLPLQSAGSTVWVRMRTVKADELPGAWSDWDSVDLDPVPPVTSLANAAGANDTERVLTWTVGDAALPVRVRWKATADADYLHSVTLPAGSNTYTITGITPGTAMTAAVDHVENAPFTGDSADSTTTWTAGSTTPTLTAPTNPQGFTDGTGNFGLQVNASVLPSRVVFEMAVEDSVGAGTYGTYAEVGDLVSESSAPTILYLTRANDGLTVKLKAKHTKTGYTDSAYTAEVIVDPWDTEGTQPDPGTSLAQATDLVMLWSGGLSESIELVDQTTGKLRLEYSVDDGDTFTPLDDTDDTPTVSLEVAGVVRGDWATPDSGFTDATNDVLLRVVALDADGTATELDERFRVWKNPAGIQSVRIGCDVLTAGTFSVDPIIGNVFIEFNAAATTVDPPPDPEGPGDFTNTPDSYPVARGLLRWGICDRCDTHNLAGGQDAVDRITDLTGNGHHLGTTADESGASVKRGFDSDSVAIPDLNGRQVVSFKDAWLQYVDDLFSGMTEGEMFLVVRSATSDPTTDRKYCWTLGTHTGPNNQPVWGEGSGAAGTGIIKEDWGSSTLRNLGDPPGITLTDWHIYNISAAAGQYVVRIDGAVILSTASNTVAFSAAAKIGSRSENSNLHYAEDAFHNVVLTTDERALVLAALQARWAL